MDSSQEKIEFDKWLSAQPVQDPDNYSLFQAFKAGYKAAHQQGSVETNCPDCGSPYPSGKYEAHFIGCPRQRVNQRYLVPPTSG